MKNYDAVIACGGLGTRLKGVTRDVPKPLYPINGKSTIERCIEELVNYGFNNLLLTIGHKSNIFVEFINRLKEKYETNIDVFIENKPLGECGALWLIKDKLSQQFVFINGDLIFSIDFWKLISFHQRLSSNLTLVTHTSDHPNDSDLVSAPNGTLIEDIFIKGLKKRNEGNAYLGNSGIFVLNKSILDNIKPPNENESKSIFHYIVRKMFDLKCNIFSYNTTEYIKDMGTPKRLFLVEKDLSQNNVNRRNYKNPQKTLFLDRDNTLIKCDRGKYVIQKEEIDFIIPNIEKIKNISFNYDFVCIITNQPTIAMGKLNLKDLDQINSIIVNFCLLRGLKIDVIAFCPHHPHKGYRDELSILKTDCFCRKPNPGLFFEQAFFRNINLKESLMIGDSNDDLYAAKNAGCSFLNVNDL